MPKLYQTDTMVECATFYISSTYPACIHSFVSSISVGQVNRLSISNDDL